jgi:hypothetical protein
MGIVVPAAATAPPDAKKDSVELLLDGITGPQPERTKTMPQTDGQASAAYHARHDVRPARTSPDDEPKVVIERAPQAPTVRIDRSRISKLEAAASRGALESTAELPPPLGPRVVVAIVSGLLVVLGLFLTLRMTNRRSSVAAAGVQSTLASGAVSAIAPTASARTAPAVSSSATETQTATSAPVAPARLGDTASVTSSAAAAASATPVAIVPPVSRAAGPVAPGGPAPTPRTKPRVSTPAVASSSGELDEFKTTFH